MDDAEQRHRPVVRQLTRQIATGNSHTVVVLIETLMQAIRHERIGLTLPNLDVAPADQPVHLLVPRTQVIGSRPGDRQCDRAPLRTRGSLCETRNRGDCRKSNDQA